MKDTIRSLYKPFAVAVVLLAAGVLVSRLGMDSEIAKIPAAKRAHMADTDWVGVQYALAGGLLVLAGILCVGISICVVLWHQVGLIMWSRGQLSNAIKLNNRNDA